MKKKFIALSVIASSFFCSGQNIALIEPKEEDDDSKCKVTLSCCHPVAL